MHPGNVNSISWITLGRVCGQNCFKSEKYNLSVESFNMKLKKKSLEIMGPEIIPETKSNLEIREIAAIES